MTAGVPANVSCVAAALQPPLQPGQAATLQTYAAHTRLLVPKPAEIRQDDVQRVVFTGNLFMLSPYAVKSQSLKARTLRLPSCLGACSRHRPERVALAVQAKLFSKDTVAYTELPPTSKSGSSLSYGPYSDVGPFHAHELRVHYENNSPFAEVTALTREVEVSHWGNVYVEEKYILKHGGARLKVCARPALHMLGFF